MRNNTFHLKQPGGKRRGKHKRCKSKSRKRKATRKTNLPLEIKSSNPGHQGPSSREQEVAEKLGWPFDWTGKLVPPRGLRPKEIIEAILMACESD